MNTVARLKEVLWKKFGTSALDSDYVLLFASRPRHPGETSANLGERLLRLLWARQLIPSSRMISLSCCAKLAFINGGLDENLSVQLLVVSGPAQESFWELITRERGVWNRCCQVAESHRSQSRRPVRLLHALAGEVQKLAAMVSALQEKAEALSVAGHRKSQSPKEPYPVCGQEGHWAKNCPSKKRRRRDNLL